MVRFTFFVHCSGWSTGGYENTHFAKDEKEARERVERWNAEMKKRANRRGNDGEVELLSVTPITNEEFAEDYIPALA